MYTADVRAATIREIEELVNCKGVKVQMTQEYEPPILVYNKTSTFPGHSQVKPILVIIQSTQIMFWSQRLKLTTEYQWPV